MVNPSYIIAILVIDGWGFDGLMGWFLLWLVLYAFLSREIVEARVLRDLGVLLLLSLKSLVYIEVLESLSEFIAWE